VVCGAKRIRSLYLPSLTRTPPELCTSLRYKAEPHSILLMARLCVFAEQTSLPRAIQSRLKAFRWVVPTLHPSRLSARFPMPRELFSDSFRQVEADPRNPGDLFRRGSGQLLDRTEVMNQRPPPHRAHPRHLV